MKRYKGLIIILVAIGLFQIILSAIVPVITDSFLKELFENTRSSSQIFRFSTILSFLNTIVWIPAAIWIYKDSKKEKLIGWLWAILVLIAHYQGIVILLLIRHVVDQEILTVTPNKEVVSDAAKDAALYTP